MAIEFEHGIKDKLVNLIPGYGGYASKERRRETDRLIRDKAVLFLEHGKGAVDQLQAMLLQLGQRNSLPMAEKLRSQVDVVMATIRSAEYGYGGLFDQVKVKENTLEGLANYDGRIIIKSKNFQRHCEELTDKAMGAPDTALKEILDLQREIEVIRKDFERRKDVINGVVTIEDDVDLS
ncbi:MAG: hypothetical protein QF415_00520 [Candidatus Undinarchaeales archaeon]|jgi:hypothetical protein|nr:hypothetical protein [Candidatus Undinarchaeales archaeon]MDP7492110.1 hypothetical protein [Candidatus Undinarchaeales archaeon]